MGHSDSYSLSLFVVLGVNPWASYVLGKDSTTEPYYQPLRVPFHAFAPCLGVLTA